MSVEPPPLTPTTASIMAWRRASMATTTRQWRPPPPPPPPPQLSLFRPVSPHPATYHLPYCMVGLMLTVRFNSSLLCPFSFSRNDNYSLARPPVRPLSSLCAIRFAADGLQVTGKGLTDSLLCLPACLPVR